jgi:DNA repair protein RadA/Sms
VETVVSTSKIPKQTSKSPSEIKPVLLSSVKRKDTRRISAKISELDRVLGGGLVGGQVVLIAGEPGIGKSTILLQLADKLGSVLYASGEESVNQTKIRADRLGVKSKGIQVMEETDIDQIVDQISRYQDTKSESNSVTQSLSNSVTLIIDSIQTMTTGDLSGMAGSVGQVRECTYRLIKLAKSTGTTVFIVGHITKQGSIAGPSVLMHLVDTVLWFEGDKSLTLRLLRAVKNRFGPTDEVGVFSMEDKGLVSLSDPEKLFLSKVRRAVSGNVVTSVMQGTRPMLIEIQALVVPTKLAYPKRIAQGIDPKRIELLLAVLQRRCGLPLYEFDCFVSVAGGISIKNDPSADLAICLSIASAYFDKPISRTTLAVGEVGLLGDIREVVAQDKRIKEARRLGYKYSISSKSAKYLQEAIKSYLR